MECTNELVRQLEEVDLRNASTGRIAALETTTPTEWAGLINRIALFYAGEWKETTTIYLFDVSTKKRYVLRVSPMLLTVTTGGIGSIRASDFMDRIIQFDGLKTISLQISDVILVDGRGYFFIELMRVAYA